MLYVGFFFDHCKFHEDIFSFWHRKAKFFGDTILALDLYVVAWWGVYSYLVFFCLLLVFLGEDFWSFLVFLILKSGVVKWLCDWRSNIWRNWLDLNEIFTQMCTFLRWIQQSFLTFFATHHFRQRKINFFTKFEFLYHFRCSTKFGLCWKSHIIRRCLHKSALWNRKLTSFWAKIVNVDPFVHSHFLHAALRI